MKAATAKDGVVAAHYASFDVSRARRISLKSDRAAYVSFRIGKDVFWTSRRVNLRRGELVLSDGESLVRARCGNRISDVPRSPVSSQEPPEHVMGEADRELVPRAAPPVTESVSLARHLAVLELPPSPIMGQAAPHPPPRAGGGPGIFPVFPAGGGTSGGVGGSPAGGALPAAPLPTGFTPPPAATILPPVAATQRPAAAAEPSTADTPPPSADTPPPAADNQTPAADVPPPAADVLPPAADILPPAADILPPATGSLPPGLFTPPPSSHGGEPTPAKPPDDPAPPPVPVLEPVPEPASLVLLVSAVLILMMGHKRRGDPQGAERKGRRN